MIFVVAAAWAAPHLLVRPGDSLESLAAAWGVDAAELRAHNGLAAGAQPRPGSLLELPARSEAMANLSQVTGEVRVRRPGQAEAAGRPGDDLPAGTVVCTGADGFATLRLASIPGGPHDEVSLLPGTCLVVEAAEVRAGRRASEVELSAGSVAVRDNAGGGELLIRTGAGLTAGQGGGFRVTVEPAAARTEAISDPVAVVGAGELLELPAAHGARVREGQAPGAPVRLLDAPALASPATGVVLAAARFDWAPVAAALGYRFFVATDPDFAFPVLVDRLPDAGWRPTRFELPAEAGAWWWRVEAIDADGFVGMPPAGRCFTAPAGLSGGGGRCPP